MHFITMSTQLIIFGNRRIIILNIIFFTFPAVNDARRSLQIPSNLIVIINYLSIISIMFCIHLSVNSTNVTTTPIKVSSHNFFG